MSTPLPLRRSYHPDLSLLTPREKQVLKNLCDGLSNKEIGRELGIEEVTVRLHLRGIFRKLDAKSRAQAVGNAMRLGVFTSSAAITNTAMTVSRAATRSAEAAARAAASASVAAREATPELQSLVLQIASRAARAAARAAVAAEASELAVAAANAAEHAATVVGATMSTARDEGSDIVLAAAQSYIPAESEAAARAADAATYAAEAATRAAEAAAEAADIAAQIAEAALSAALRASRAGRKEVESPRSACPL